jgi:hypothetical protein
LAVSAFASSPAAGHLTKLGGKPFY